ncbi:hypothetical protein NMG60_11017271 [Bertholletia excelsa]
MSCPTVSATNITGGVVAVDCHKQVRSRRLLRSLAELLIPTCKCVFLEQNHNSVGEITSHKYYPPRRSSVSSTLITGTIFGGRRGKVSLCIQTDPKSRNPLLLLELAVPTTALAKEMRNGTLRIALECTAIGNNVVDSSCSLLSMPVWRMYCNGRIVGFAFKPKPTQGDIEVLQLMEKVEVGAGTISAKEMNGEDEIMYLRSNFERVRGSLDSQSFHLIDPEGNIGQELSIFFLRNQ